MEESSNSPIETEAASWTDPIVTGSADALRGVEEVLDSASQGIWDVFHDHPRVGAVVCGGLGLGGAMVIGVAEMVATVVAGYIGYRMFAYGEALTEAFEKSIQLREGKLRKEEM